MQDFRRLQVWQKGHELALAVYRETRSFPKEEMYGLTSQIRRSAVSVPANIAEGCGRGRPGELARFLEISMGSAFETDYHILLAKDLGMLASPGYDLLSTSVTDLRKMLSALMSRVRGSN